MIPYFAKDPTPIGWLNRGIHAIGVVLLHLVRNKFLGHMI